MTTMNRRDGHTGRVRATESGTYIFPLSSEAPYRRYDGIEILDHSPEAVDLSFLNSGNAPLLDSHDRYSGLEAQIGVIERAWIDNKRVYVEVRFSNRPKAQEYRQDVDDGIIRNVSVGYDVKKVERETDSEEYRVVKWTPKEASFVSIPADETVGMGRSAKQEGRKMPAENPNSSSTRDDANIPVLPGVRTDEQRAEALETAINEITALATEHNMGDIARAYIHGQMQRGDEPRIEVFRGIVRANLPEHTPLRNEDIGLTDQETRQFSIVRLARTMMDGASRADMEAASFELEAVEAAGAARNGQHRLPAELMRSWGDFEVGGYRSTDPRVRAALGTAGNANVQSTDHLAARFIDNLRNRLVLGGLGVTILSGLDGNVEIPGGNANIASAWLGAEDADAAESNPSFRKVTMSIHDLAVYTDMTRRMLIQTTIDIENYVRGQILQAMAQGIDTAGFYGDGTGGAPTGLLETAGIGSVDFAGAIPTRNEIIDMRTEIASSNRTGSPVFVGSSAMMGGLMKTKIDAGSGMFLMQTEGRLSTGNTFEETNQIADADLFAGVWQDMMMGMWGSLELDRSTEAKFLSGGLRLRAIQSVDFAVARTGSFVYGTETAGP